MSLELHDVPIFRLEFDTSGTLSLYFVHTCIKLKGPVLEMYLLWCRTGICSWNVTVEGSFMLDDPFSVSFLCILKYISLYFIHNSIQVVNFFWRKPYYLKMIPGVLGRSLNSNIIYKFLCGRPVFPDYLSVSYDYDKAIPFSQEYNLD